MKLHLLIYCVYSLCFRTVNSQDVRPMQRLPGPDSLVTDGTRNLTLTCPAESSGEGQYTWFTPGKNKTRCETQQSGKVCIFIPRLEDDNQNVSCTLVDPGPVISTSTALYQVNLKYPPQSSPNITIEPRRTEPLKQGDNITCTVTGGKPRVLSVTLYCQHPDLADREDDVSDDGRTVSSSITVDTSQTTEVNTNCTCEANWAPETGLYADKTTMSFQFESAPRIVESYDSSNPPTLPTEGLTFALVAYPEPEYKESNFLGNMDLTTPVLAPENTFTVQCTRSMMVEHLVYCHVTPRNVPKEKVGLYELTVSNGLGDASFRFRVESPVTPPQDEDSMLTVAIVGAVVGVLLVIGIIVIIVICLRRRKRNAGRKGHHGSQNRNRNNGTTAPVTNTTPTSAAAHVSRPDSTATATYDKINDGPSSAGGNTTAARCSTDSKGYTSVGDASLQGSNKAAPTRHNNVPPTGYEDVELDMLGAPKIKNTPEKPNVDASIPEDSAERITDPKDYVYAKVAPKQKGDNQPIA